MAAAVRQRDYTVTVAQQSCITMKIWWRLSDIMIILQLLSSEAASLQKNMVAAMRQHDYVATVTVELHWDRRMVAAVHR